MKEIICIPGRRKKKNLKVAAYCRVSTKEESQQGSIDSQALYYEQLIVCGHCGASYRRRTERGKVVWRCATRIEKGKTACSDSVTVNEEQLKTVLANVVCNGCYDEEMVRNRVLSIKVFEDRLEIFDKNGNVI